MNIVHLVVVKNSFYILESGRTIRKSAHFSLILGTKNLVKIGTQHLSNWHKWSEIYWSYDEEEHDDNSANKKHKNVISFDDLHEALTTSEED